MSNLFIKTKRKVCIIFHKKFKIKKNPKNQKKNIFRGFFRWFFISFFGWVFWVGFFGEFLWGVLLRTLPEGPAQDRLRPLPGGGAQAPARRHRGREYLPAALVEPHSRAGDHLPGVNEISRN
jgi:hypothetical protein